MRGGNQQRKGMEEREAGGDEVTANLKGFYLAAASERGKRGPRL